MIEIEIELSTTSCKKEFYTELSCRTPSPTTPTSAQ